MAIFMRANAPSEATAKNSFLISAATEQSDDQTDGGFEMSIQKESYGVTKAGENVTRYVCTNDNGFRLEMIDYGATISAFFAPDRNGNFENITLGCSGIEGYEVCQAYLGSTVGRYANRIANASFNLDEVTYRLDANEGKHHLHGGKAGFDKRIWNSEEIHRDGNVGVRFSLLSEDGDGGYPGNLEVSVEYTINNANELKISYSAICDKTTPINLTNHAYWNLAGATSGTILGQQVEINAEEFLTIDQNSIPTTKSNVTSTPFDFREMQTIGERFNQTGLDPVGYDHCYLLKTQRGNKTPLAARVFDPSSGRKMEVFTDQPGIQLYTGNHLDGQPNSGGYGQHQAICLEAQALPDAPNRPDFPSSLLHPGETYEQTTLYRFGVVED